MSLRRRKMEGSGVKRLTTIPLPVGAFGVPPISGYNGWFDALDTASLTLTSSQVSQWSDKSGNGNHLTQATAASQPNYGLGQINGLPCLQFDGSNDSLASTALSGSDRTSSLFVVICIHATIDFNTIRGSNGGTGGNEFRVNTTDGHLQTLRSGVATVGDMSTPVVTPGIPVVAAQILTATDVTHYLNRSSETDSDSNAFTSARTTTIGQNRSGGTSFARINIGEMIFYDTTLSSGDAVATINYLMNKWGIS